MGDVWIERLDAELDAVQGSPTSAEISDITNKFEATSGVAVAVRRAMEGGGGGSQPAILMDSTHLTAAQLLDLDNTGVELLPAPGGRFYYMVHSMILHYRFVTTPYNEGGIAIGSGLLVYFGSAIPADFNQPEAYIRPLASGGSPDTKDLFKQTQDAYVMTLGEVAVLATYEWTAATIENKAISVAITPQFSTPLTGGDSTLSVRTFYSLIDGAP